MLIDMQLQKTRQGMENLCICRRQTVDGALNLGGFVYWYYITGV